MRARYPTGKLLQSCRYLSQRDRSSIEHAVDLAAEAHSGQMRADGTPYFDHLVAVAEILAEWHADRDTIIAGLLHDALEDTPLTREMIEREFGPDIALLVDGVTKFTQADLADPGMLDRKVETIRKLLDVMRKDIRVIIIKLADRLHNIRTLSSLLPAQRQRFARETLQVYSRFAYHLGMNAVRREFAEACVPLAHPEAAAALLQARETTMQDRTETLRKVQHDLHHHPDAPKPFPDLRLGLRAFDTLLELYERGELQPEQAYYIVVVVRKEEDCYSLLQTLHTLYRPLSGQFRDYIAAPTASGYRSLHTTVVGPLGSPLQIRIRSKAIDEEDQLGVVIRLFQRGEEGIQDLAWLRRSESLDTATKESSEAFWRALQSDIFQNATQVTVDGQTVSLPVESTVLDAVYARYGEDAHLLRSAELDGRKTTLSAKVHDDAVVKTAMDNELHVSFERLDAVTTRYARGLIVEALKRRSREEKMALGERLMQKELDYFQRGLVSSVSRQQQESLAKQYRRPLFEDVIAMVGEGVLDAKDVVFRLYPDVQKGGGKPKGAHDFRLHITGALEHKQDVLGKISQIAKTFDVDILHTDLHLRKSGAFSLSVRGRAPDTNRFADFAAALQRAEWTSEVQTLISYSQRFFLASSFVAAFAIVVLDVILLPYYHNFIGIQPFLPALILQLLPLLPVFAVNYYILWLLRHYLVRMRSDRWYLGLGFLLNIAGIFVLLTPSSWNVNTGSLLPIVAVFIFSMLSLAWQFYQTEKLFTGIEHRPKKQLSIEEAQRSKRRKVTGYLIRFAAVIIWGIEPLYIRYTSVNTLAPFLRTLLLSIGVLVVFGAIHLCRHLFQKRTMRIPYDKFFLILIVGQVGYMYFKNASLVYTTGTNFLLFNNFTPVVGFLIAAIFWRQDIPYLRQPRTMLWIFLLAVTSGLGSSILLLNSLATPGKSVIGDFLALAAMFFDVLLTIGQIEYAKRHLKMDGVVVNLHIFSCLLLLTAPTVVAAHLLGFPILHHLNNTNLLLGLGIGAFVGFGQFLNYEAFKRIDGYLAFMLFNLSVLLTFTGETLIFKTVTPGLILFVSTILIIGSSIGAEWINSRAERNG